MTTIETIACIYLAVALPCLGYVCKVQMERMTKQLLGD